MSKKTLEEYIRTRLHDLANWKKKNFFINYEVPVLKKFFPTKSNLEINTMSSGGFVASASKAINKIYFPTTTAKIDFFLNKGIDPEDYTFNRYLTPDINEAKTMAEVLAKADEEYLNIKVDPIVLEIFLTPEQKNMVEKVFTKLFFLKILPEQIQKQIRFSSHLKLKQVFKVYPYKNLFDQNPNSPGKLMSIPVNFIGKSFNQQETAGISSTRQRKFLLPSHWQPSINNLQYY